MLSIIEKVLALEKQEIFSTLTLEQLSHIAEQATEVSFKKGAILFREGEPADSVYFILKGRVRLMKGGVLVRTVEENGPPVGGLAIFTDSDRHFTAEAATSCLTLHLLRDDFVAIMYAYQEIPIHILKMMARTIVDMSVSWPGGPREPVLARMGLYPAPELPARGPGDQDPARQDPEDDEAQEPNP